MVCELHLKSVEGKVCKLTRRKNFLLTDEVNEVSIHPRKLEKKGKINPKKTSRKK